MKKVCLLLVVVLAITFFAGCKTDPDATYSVLYYGNGSTSGIAPTDPNQYKSGDEATVLGRNTLIKVGYEFLNWNTKEDGTGVPCLPGETITINGAVFLYAKWVVLP